MILIKYIKNLLAHVRVVRRIGGKAFIGYYIRRKDSRVLLEVEGYKVVTRARTSDLKVVVESLTKEYSFLDDLLPDGFSGLMVDAGGYIGTAAIAFASRFPNATVVTVEPSSANLALLRENVSPFKNIHVVPAALGPSAEGSIGLNDRKTGNWGFTVVEGSPSKGANELIENVALTSLAKLEQDFAQPIVFLKLDVEGAEKSIFDENDDELQRIPLIFAELHDRIVPGCDASFRNISRDRWVLKLTGEKFLSAQRSKDNFVGWPN